MLTFGYMCYILTESVEGNEKKLPLNRHQIWGLSSAGRASALQAEGHRFEPYRPHNNRINRHGEIAQLARAYGSYP